MPVPEFNEIKAPALQFFADGHPHKISEVYAALAKQFGLSDADLSELLPSGIQSRWNNRASWACYDLYRAGLLDRPRRGVYTITELGKKVATQKPQKIDREYLMQFPGFAKFIEITDQKGNVDDEQQDVSVKSAATPDEVMANAYRTLQSTLKTELLDLIRKIDPHRFERLVVDLLLAMGYGGSREEAATVTGKSHDEGIDGLINEDRLGLDRLYIQAKRWQNTVGRPELHSFVGALAGKQAQKGIFITSGDFSSGAREYMEKNLPQRVILIDGPKLAELMIEHNIGVSRASTYEIKRVDSDYFEEA